MRTVGRPFVCSAQSGRLTRSRMQTVRSPTIRAQRSCVSVSVVVVLCYRALWNRSSSLSALALASVTVTVTVYTVSRGCLPFQVSDDDAKDDTDNDEQRRRERRQRRRRNEDTIRYDTTYQ